MYCRANFVLIGVALVEGPEAARRAPRHTEEASSATLPLSSMSIYIDDGAVWKRLAEKMVYVRGDLTKRELYEKLRSALGEAEKTTRHEGQRHLLSRGCGSAVRLRGGESRQGEAHPSGRGTKTASIGSGAVW